MKTLFACLLCSFASCLYAQNSNARNHLHPISRNYLWTYAGNKFNMSLTFNREDYSYYKHKSKATQSTQSYVRFSTEDSIRPYINTILQKLMALGNAQGFNRDETADFIIAFVQQAVDYKTDPFNWGKDYPRYSIETLVDHHGDCEDKACLMIALLRSLDYDVALISMSGHMAMGMACSDCEGRSFQLDGCNYYFVETTGPGNPIGYEAAEMQPRTHRLYAVPQTTFYEVN